MSEVETKIDGRSREARMAKAGGAVGKESSMDSKARAEARIREIRESIPDGGAARDKFYAPPPPDGWDYQWKLKSVMGQDDTDRIRQNEMNGWEPVPLSRHPELMPRDWKGNTIEVGGLRSEEAHV